MAKVVASLSPQLPLSPHHQLLRKTKLHVQPVHTLGVGQGTLPPPPQGSCTYAHHKNSRDPTLFNTYSFRPSPLQWNNF